MVAEQVQLPGVQPVEPLGAAIGLLNDGDGLARRAVIALVLPGSQVSIAFGPEHRQLLADLLERVDQLAPEGLVVAHDDSGLRQHPIGRG